jgi:hypothetical protein
LHTVGGKSRGDAMHRSESRELANCLICGAEIAPGRDRTFALTAERFLCFRCAVHRGGSWDEQRDHWTTEPETGDLLREE